jgi:hypothetical protein
VACMETQKSDAVLDSCSIICVLFMLAKKQMFWAEIGAKRPKYSQNRTVQWDRPSTIGTVLFKRSHRPVRYKYGMDRLDG